MTWRSKKPPWPLAMRDRIAYRALVTSRWAVFLTLVAVCFNGVVAIVAINSLSLNSRTAQQSQQAAELQAKLNSQLAEATERSSTAGRAYLFVNYPVPQAARVTPPRDFSEPFIPDQQKPVPVFRVPIRFSIKNFGPTPAIITKVETHLFVSKNGLPIQGMPIPGSTEASELEESIPAGTISGVDIPPPVGGISFIDTREQSHVMLAGSGESGTLEETFVFHNRVLPMTSTLHGSWFYCAITYKDIFGIKDRHTFFYVELAGAGFIYAKDPEYNRWD